MASRSISGLIPPQLYLRFGAMMPEEPLWFSESVWWSKPDWLKDPVDKLPKLDIKSDEILVFLERRKGIDLNVGLDVTAGIDGVKCREPQESELAHRSCSRAFYWQRRERSSGEGEDQRWDIDSSGIDSRLNNAFKLRNFISKIMVDFHKRILFSDEAHFWLNGYVNKQNCRIWSKANPQVYVETPLHPEKLTVWCALWAGGILLQKR
ncbi:hypothetical protein TNCV_1332571 [Trichonephila clavipes]|nr:hypothetical protein TNCV_1332571 [Trichonephila clavipes]